MFCNCVLYERKLSLYDLKIFGYDPLVVNLMLKTGIEDWLALYEVSGLL